MRSIPLLSLVLTLSLAACDGDDDSITLAQLPTTSAQAQCASLFRCCDADEIMGRYGCSETPITTETECVTVFTGLYQATLDAQMAALAAGRIVYDADKAAACVARLDAAACGNEYEAASATCDAFIGKVATGGTCEVDQECAAADSYCMQASAAMGRCVELPAIGDACDNNVCRTGAYCDLDLDECAALKADGATCDLFFECASTFCSDTGSCAPRPPATTCDGV